MRYYRAKAISGGRYHVFYADGSEHFDNLFELQKNFTILGMFTKGKDLAVLPRGILKESSFKL